MVLAIGFKIIIWVGLQIRVTYWGSHYLGGYRMSDNFKPSSNFLKQLRVIRKPICAECRYDECHYAECRSALIITPMITHPLSNY